MLHGLQLLLKTSARRRPHPRKTHQRKTPTHSLPVGEKSGCLRLINGIAIGLKACFVKKVVS